MPYDRKFNNPAIIFTAFTGNMVTTIPELDWQLVPHEDIGMDNFELGIGVYDDGNGHYLLWGNGDSYLSSGDPKLRYFDMATKSWMAASGFPFRVHYAGNGYFLSIVNDRIYACSDGRNWTTAGVLGDLGAQGCCAVATNGSSATAMSWNADIPVYSGSVSGGYWSGSDEQTEIAFFSPFREIPEGMDHLEMPSPFIGVEYHRGSCVAFAYGGEDYCGICTGGGSAWSETMSGPYAISGLRSVHGKLFMRLSLGSASQLCVVDDSLSSYQVALSSSSSVVPFLDAVIWCDRLHRFMAAADSTSGQSATLFSSDGLHWQAAPTVGNFTPGGGSLIYIPGVGFYSVEAGALYFAEYTA